MGNRGFTEDKFAICMGTNHFGHFVFTSGVFSLLKNAVGKARIVSVASVAHEWSKTLGLEDLNWESRKYDWLQAYAASKLANVLFAKSLAKKCEEQGLGDKISVVSQQPGYAYSNLYRGWTGGYTFARICGDSCRNLRVNELRAACDPTLESGCYLEPHKRKFTGYPVVAPGSDKARDSDLAEKLWVETEKMTGESFGF